jgi:hypothetical protein
MSCIKKLRRLQWAGHVIQMNDERIPKKALQQTIYGKRAVGQEAQEEMGGCSMGGLYYITWNKGQ